ncbi:MAG: hypothetical protein IJZ68_07540 [Bacteroidaceae bacterium]|nr:hypothetical protein [Bacteroidaceae bacterium]
MIKKSIKTHTRLLTCLVALAVVFVTFLAGMSTTNASTDVFGDIELKVGDTLGFVYYTSQPYTENTKMRFTVNGRTSESIAYPNDGKCVFIFNDIYPHELAKEVTATIVVNGKETVSSTGLSIKTYLLKMLMDPDSTAEELQFASDTLQYGEQTRLYRNANVDVADRDNVSITDDINTSIYTKYNPQDIESVYPGTAQGLGVSASNIRLASIGISYYNVNKYVVTLQVPTGSNINLQNIKVQIGNEMLSASSFIEKGNGQYEVHSSAINAYDILDKTTPINTDIKLYVNNKIVQQASYNILDYIYQLQDTTQNNSLALRYARSLYRYGQSAEAAYNGNRIISIALKQNPGDANGQMVPSNTSAQTPTGGKITAYYSDGTSSVISEGITWNNKDIYGNEVKITDDTHLKSFTVLGSYTDTVSGKTYTVTGVIELHNDMVNATRYTDPSEYSPTSSTWTTSYTPTGSKLHCTWANGYTSNRSSTHSAIDMTNYKFDEYGFIPTTASYTDPKSGITKTAKTYLVYRNPIASINLANTTANYNDGTLDANTIPHTTTYTLTFQNGQTWSTSKATTETTWTNSIQNGDSAKNVTYSFAWTVMGSTASETRINFTQTATGNLTTPAYGTWVKKTNGNNANFSVNARTVSGNCTATVSNPEHGLVIESVPSVYGGTVKGVGNLTGKPSSTTAGQLSGGKVYMRYWNNATETVNSKVIYSSASITNTAYSKNVTVTASYTGKDGNNKTATAQITIYNYLTGISQTTVPEVRSASTTNTNFPLSGTKNTMTATYANGKTEVVGTGATATTNIYINNEQRNSECFVQSISTATVTTADRTQAGVSATTGNRYNIVVKYDDYRTNDAYTGSIQTINGYKVKVRNTYAYISTERVGPVYMTGANATPKPTNAVTVILSNGQPFTHSGPSYGQPASITNATEYVDRTISVSCTSADGVTVSRNVQCYVVNQAVSATNHTNPSNIQVYNTSQVQGTSLSGGKITVTFKNGQSATLSCTSYTTGSDAKITDTTTSKTVGVTGTWTGSFSSASATQYLTLTNPANSSGSLANTSLTLSSSGQSPTSTLTVTHSNGQTQGYSVYCSTVYSSGTTSNSGATTAESGNCAVSASVSVSGVTVSGSATCYWTNPVTKIEDNWAAWRNCSTSSGLTLNSNMIQGESVKATLNNGATKNVTPSIDYNGDVDNITGDTYSKYYYVTARYGGQSCTMAVLVYNPLNSLSISNKSATQSSGTVTTYVSGTAYYLNGYSKSVSPSCSVTSADAGSGNGYTGGVTFSYSGTDQVYYNAYCSGSYTENGHTVSDSFTISYTNTFYVTVYTSSSYTTVTKETTGYDSSHYAYIYFGSGNGYTETTTGRAYARLTFANDATLNKGEVSLTGTHYFSSSYRNGGSSLNTSDSSNFVSKSVSYTVDGYTASDSFWMYTYTLVDERDYYCYGIDCLTTLSDSRHIYQTDWYCNMYGVTTWTNGYDATTATSTWYKPYSSSTTYAVGTISSDEPYIYNTRGNTWGTNYSTYGKWRSDLYGAGWLGNDFYISAQGPSSYKFGGNDTYYPYSTFQQWSSASSIEVMGY